MTKIQFNGNQFTITISKEIMEKMGWKKGTDIFVGKDRESDFVYIENLNKKRA